MAEEFYPFDNTAVATELQWSRLMRVLSPDGVDALPANPDLAVTKTGTLTVSVAPGGAWLRGFLYRSDAAAQLTLPVNPASTPRIDRIVLRADLGGNNISVGYVLGTPSGTPVAPALTSSDATGVYELPLALVRVESTDTISTVTDNRAFLGRPVAIGTSANRPVTGGRPTVAIETDTGRVITSRADGTWNVGLADDLYRPLFLYSASRGITLSDTWDTDLTSASSPTVDILFTAPPSGRVMIRCGAYVSVDTSAATALMAVRLTSAAGVTYWAATGAPAADRYLQFQAPSYSGSTDPGASLSGSFYAPTLTPGTAYNATLRYRVSAGTGIFDERWLEVDPLP